MRGLVVATVAASVAVGLTGVRRVEASGGLLSPQPVGEAGYAVNARGEQVIFEVEPGFVTAHVLIEYSGAPETFAWIIPVPSQPEVALSDERAFALLDDRTRPLEQLEARDICPRSRWDCHYASECGDIIDDADDFVPSPITLVQRQVVGGYETITFQADEGAAAVQWLRDEGFIVNDTITPYIQRYVDRGMLFVAAKLLPGADATAIAPLKLRYAAEYPELPLELTAIAADPHMTVTAFVYGQDYVRPAVQPIIELDEDRFARDRAGRVNYPMVLARTIDEYGGGAFVVEYRGAPPLVYTKAHSSCCEQPGDTCVFEGNGTCDCLRDDWDQDDCTGFLELIPAMEMLDDLAARHVAFTRLTTRVSPEEMTFDPFFVPDFVAGTGQDAVVGFHYTLDACEPAILGEDEDEYRAARARLDCAAVYCGHGTCATTDAGAACACDAGYVARAFTDLDGLPSVTCVPAVPLVDLEAGGIDLPDACATTSCGAGVCVDQNGVATCACDSGAAAVAGERPQCVPIVELTGSPGGEDFSEAFTEVRVCAPPPPSCGADGSLVFHEETPGGVSCGGEVPDPSLVGDPCDEGFFEGCGCRTTDGGGAGALLGVLVALLLRRRKETV